MGRTLEFEVEVKPGDVDKRQSLTAMVDMGILMGGMRVRAGTYKVTIEKVDPKKQVKP